LADFFYFCEVNSIVIIGSGNVGSHLAKLFKHHSIEVKHYNRNKENATFLDLSSINEVRNSWIIICVNDDAIQTIIDRIHTSNNLLYTSGAVSIKQLHFNGNLGVFYPLQTFSKDKHINYDEIPFLIEGSCPAFEQSILMWFHFITTLIPTDSEKRKKIHLIAVFINNFTHHIHYLAQQLSQKHSVDSTIFKALINETFDKIQHDNLYISQTGPAKRGDYETIQTHLELLSEEEQLVYKTLTNSILKTYNHEEL